MPQAWTLHSIKFLLRWRCRNEAEVNLTTQMPARVAGTWLEFIPHRLDP